MLPRSIPTSTYPKRGFALVSFATRPLQASVVCSENAPQVRDGYMRSCTRGLLALFAPTQLPSSAQKGWAGELLLRVNPLTAGEHYVGKILVSGHTWSEDVSWLGSPIAAAALFVAVAAAVGGRFVRLRGGVAG